MSTAVQPEAAPASAEVSQSGPYGVDNAIAEITRSAIEQTTKESTARDLPERNDKGQFVPKDGQLVPELKPGESQQALSPKDAKAVSPAPDAVAAAPDAISGAPAPETDVETVELPEGYVLAPKVEGRELKTQFKVIATDGSELEIPDVKIGFKANGKDRVATLDHVVKMAEWGVYNQERHEQMERAVQESQAVRQQLDQVAAYARRLEDDREALLSDDNAYLRERARYAALNTPEAQAQRAREDLHVAQQQAELARVQSQGTQFYTTELLPAVNTIAKALPHVSDEELGAKLLLISDRYKQYTAVGSFIPPQSYDAIRNAILSDVVPWAQQLNDAREHERASATKEHAAKTKAAEDKARTAQITAQKAKSLVGRVTRPVGKVGNGTPTREAPKAKPIVTVEDAEKSALDATMAAVMGTG